MGKIMTDNELRTVQLKELEILKAVRDICDRHGLRYYIAGGTLLGAVRHKGFIPWDDDVDIEMVRPDYEKFIQYAKEELPDNLALENYKLTPDKSRIPFLKVTSQEVQLVMNYASKPIYTGLFIDIFPIDGMPDKGLRLKLYKMRVLWLRMLRNYADMDGIHMHRTNRPFIERFLIKFGQISHIGKILNYEKITDKTEKYVSGFKTDKSKVYFSPYSAYKFKQVNPVSDYGRGKKYLFEGEYFNGPEYGERILTKVYGDYSILPPPEERGLHHGTELVENKNH